MHTVPVILPDGTGLKDAKNAIVKISHILNKRAGYASNFSREIQTSVQIQIWYEYDDSLAEQYDDLLNDYFESNGFYSFESYISVDPDIEKLYLTAKFKNKCELVTAVSGFLIQKLSKGMMMNGNGGF